MEAPKLLKRRKMVRTGREIAGQREMANHETACKRAATKTMKRQVSMIIFTPVINSSSAIYCKHFLENGVIGTDIYGFKSYRNVLWCLEAIVCCAY